MNQKGQAELEFMLILPLFLAIVFGLLLFAMAMFKAQMLTYATFWGGRSAEVGQDYQSAANAILPGVVLSVEGPSSNYGEMNVKGRYQNNPFIRPVQNSSLDAGVAYDSNLINMEVNLRMYRFNEPADACNKESNDNCYNVY